LGKRAVLVPKIKQIGREEAQQQLANGHAALSKGQIQAALAACGDALKNDKVRCRAQTCLAEIAFTEGDFHKAVQEGERAVRCPGADRDAHLMLGDAYLRDGKADKAREQYQTVLRIDPENRAALAGIERTRPTAKAPF
jgi:Tfp pilus assembly protein PilF